MKPYLSLIFLLILNAALSMPLMARAETDTDADGVPDPSEVLLGTDPLVADTDGDGANDLADAEATFLPNPMQMAGPTAPFLLAEALVEDNYDPAKKADATDHLELLIQNPGPTDLTGFSIYYAIKDADTGTMEATFRTLDGFSVPAGGEARLHIDEGVEPGHFRANPNSIYITSQAAKTFSVALQSAGFAPVVVEIAKDKGGPEAAD